MEEELLQNPETPTRKRRRRRAASRKRRKRKETEEQKITALISQYDLEHMLQNAVFLKRRFVLHCGPTNSGKTYDALQALRRAGTGTYLGPLRLLALEMFDRLNESGCRCDLLTGEEHIEVPEADLVSSTIELCNYNRHYDVAVIDEAQMLSDEYRGAHWTRAILGVDAEVVHVCFAPEARKIIVWLLERIGAEYELLTHRRLCPLRYEGKLPSLRSVEPGDALITFSRRNVLGLSAELEKRGIRASVIYGALPPESRREEVRKFASGQTQVVVATDAIGMGISLPIRRIIFCETQKYDGTQRRELSAVEVRQIAGRAGRYGIYDEGLVLTLADDGVVERGLEITPPMIRTITTPFPVQALDSPYPLEKLLDAWRKLPIHDRERRADVSDSMYLLRRVKDRLAEAPKALAYELITCPVDTSTIELVWYWMDCVLAVLRDSPLPHPNFDTNTLRGCELQYRAYDIRFQLLRRVYLEEPDANIKRELSAKINRFLKDSKTAYQRVCPLCQKELPFNWPYRTCEDCRYLAGSDHRPWRRARREEGR